MAIFSSEYLRLNDQQTKNIIIIVEIEGVDLLSNSDVYTKVRYGDAGIKYGDAGLIYGGLRKLSGVRSLISLDNSSLTLSQKNEPEQGRASVSTLSLGFVDKDGYMTEVVSRGTIVPEILSREVNVYLGYKEISYPEDYLRIFRGRITQVESLPGLITLQFSDPNFNRRQNTQVNSKAKVLGGISNVDTTILVDDNSLFPQHVLGPDGTYHVGGPWNPNGTHNPLLVAQRDGVRTFLKIEDEYIEYGPLGFGSNQFTGCLRGARGTTAVAHAAAKEVSCFVEFQDNAINIALSMMLSGWNGPWKTKISPYSFITTFDPILGNQPGAIILQEKIDASVKYGLTAGDYVSIQGGVNNGLSGKIVRFGDLFGTPNRIIYLDTTLSPEFPTAATISFRSQFDVYPAVISTKLTPQDVDVEKHLKVKNDFLSGDEHRLRFFYSGSEALKSFLEREVYLPTNTYSLTQRGRLAVGYTKPPLADERLVVLDKTNILNPNEIKPQRGLNMRKFFNEIDWEYDSDDASVSTSFYKRLDVDSISTFGVVSTLPIKSKGLRTDLDAKKAIEKRSNFTLSRYKNAAVLFSCKVNWATGCTIETGDIVAVQDDGFLKISNFATGERNLGTQLYEVLERSLDIKTGQASITLVSDVAADVSDRYATVSPSSVIVSGASDHIIITDSFGAIYPGNESEKWSQYLNQNVRIHSDDYTFTATAKLLSIDPINNYKINISDLSATPVSWSGLILDIIDYPNTTSKTDAQLYKMIHAFLSPTVAVTSGASQTQFDVGVGDIGKFFVGSKIEVHTEDYATLSPEVTVTNIGPTTITVDKSLGFTPNATHLVSGIGFTDRQGSYRAI